MTHPDDRQSMTQGTTSFNHVGICVADRDRSRRFYEGLLGFTFWWEIDPPDEEISLTVVDRPLRRKKQTNPSRLMFAM